MFGSLACLQDFASILLYCRFCRCISSFDSTRFNFNCFFWSSKCWDLFVKLSRAFSCATLVLAAFSEEIIWAGLTSVDSGQWKAARSTGLSLNQTLIWIILPQAFRLAIPPLTNRAIAITKMTALGTVIGVPDILNQATTAQSFSGNASPLMIAAIIYVVIFLPLVVASRWLEEKFSWRKA